VIVKDVLLEMRTFRMGLIQTADQLKFSYYAILQGLQQFANVSFIVIFYAFCVSSLISLRLVCFVATFHPSDGNVKKKISRKVSFSTCMWDSLLHTLKSWFIHLS